MQTLTEKEVKQNDQQEAAAQLKKYLSGGDTVYGIVRHVSQSGMSRDIDFYVFRSGAPVWLSGYMSRALDLRRAKNGALKINGCGMDMIFATVYNLGSILFDDGYKLKSQQL